MVSENLKRPVLAKLRTISMFVSLDKDKTTQKKRILEASTFGEKLAKVYESKGYEVQSIRIVTNPFNEYLDTSSLDNVLEDMHYIKNVLESDEMPKYRIRFAIGEAISERDISYVPRLIKDFEDMANICVNVEVDNLGIANNKKILHCVDVMKEIGKTTPRGEGNFNFTVNFNCKPLIPYFPASYFKSELEDCFALGFETPDLLVAALKEANLDQYSDINQRYKAAFEVMFQALNYHIDFLTTIAKENELSTLRFVGVDSSAAPSKNCSSMTEVYKLLGVEYFGASGSVEASSILTKVFKSIKNTNLIGFSGLMLAVVEDLGLAEGTIKDEYDIRSLLLYSAICGIGLDTVPIADDASQEKIAALMRDTATMAYRLNKPLTVRLFPVPNKSVGQMSAFESDDLCNSKILKVH